MMSLNKAIKKYQLIEFKDEQTNDGKLSVECVPSSWITFDASVGACMVRFLPPPYDKESFRLLTDLIKNHVDAPEGWPFYQCSLLGHAQTYPEAMKKLNKLQSRPYAYTTDNDDHAREKSVTMTQLYKALRSKEQDDLEKVMDVRGISSDVNANEIYSSSSSNGEDSTSDENTASLCQKKKKSTKKSEPVGKNDAKKKSVTASSCKISKRPSKTSGVSTQESKKSQPTPRASSAHSSHKKIISTSSDREMQPERELQMPQLADNAQEHATRDQASLHRPKSPDAGLLVSAANENNVEENWEIIIGAEKGEKIVFSNDTKLLYIAINKLTCLVKSLSEESQTLRNSVERCMRLKINKMDKKKFEEKYAFEKPRTSVEFFVFDQRLTTEEDFHNDFKSCRRECHESSNRKTNAIFFGDKGPRFSGSANFNATLHCKDIDVIKISHNSGIWVIEESSYHDDSWRKTGRIQVSEKMTSVFKNLSAGTNYRYKAYRIMGNEFISEPEVTPCFSTFEMGHRPEELNYVEVVNQTLDDKNPSRVRADIIIQPGSDRSCRYDVISWNENEGLTIAEFESSQDFRFSLDNLDYATNVTVFVSARNIGSPQNSNNVSLAFVTPSCFQLQRNLTFCAPDQVKGLRISRIFENGSDYEIVVAWNKPEIFPDNYVLQFQYLDYVNEESTLITLPGNSTEANLTIKKSKVDHRQRIISIVAESSGGTSFQTWIYVNMEETLNIFSAKGTASTASNNFFKHGIMAISSVAVFTAIAGISYVYHLRRQKSRTNDDKNRYKYCQNLKGGRKDLERSFYGLGKTTSLEFEKKYPLIPKDEFEICPIQLTIKDVLLGSGAYGTVRLGRFYSPKKQAINVAVKTLRDDANAEDLKNFRQEISIMKSAGHHPNIVSIIGCCTLDIRKPLLIVEYCSRGDLQTYLRTLWQEIMSQALECRVRRKIADQDNTVKAIEINNVENAMNMTSWIVAHQVAIANKLYDIQGEDMAVPKNDSEVTVADLLKFGRQIASGMEFLSSNRIIHRDLAARNVLVCADKTVKISDFGLSRDIYQENVYKKQGNGRLPLKWMAIEALTHQIYTTKSDVWSFGILLWEIVTLGSNPYPETPTNMVLQLLKSGYRMQKPDNCGNELYDIMRSCWHSRPRYRPNFTQLKNKLDDLLLIVNSNENLKILRDPINSRNSSKLVNNNYSNIYSK